MTEGSKRMKMEGIKCNKGRGEIIMQKELERQVV